MDFTQERSAYLAGYGDPAALLAALRATPLYVPLDVDDQIFTLIVDEGPVERRLHDVGTRPGLRPSSRSRSRIRKRVRGDRRSVHRYSFHPGAGADGARRRRAPGRHDGVPPDALTSGPSS